MARNRIIYQSEALYAGPSPATGNHFEDQATESGTLVKQLHRIQTANYSFNIARTDVNQFGELAAIDRVILESPTVSLDFSYLLNGLKNEEILGFGPLNSATVSCISGILNKTSDERNYFIRTTAEGADALGVASSASNQSVIGIGNGFVTSYSSEASVGNFPTVTLNVEALNMSFDSAVTGKHIPAVNPTDGTKITGINYALLPAVSSVGATGISALRPGDITLDIPYTEGGVSITDAKIQSYTLSFDLAREPLQKLGSKFAFAREITFPVTVNLSIDALVGDLTTGNLADIIGLDKNYDLTITLKNTDNTPQVRYYLRRAKLDSQEFSSSIGDNKSVTLNFSTQIGGPNQNDRGLMMSGVTSL